MNHLNQLLVRTACAAAVFGAAGIAGAGSLEPPPGVIKPSMKTLDEVEARRPIHQSDLPMTINVSGSYYVAENLHPTLSGLDMITVVAENVSIDLNGFTINGTSQNLQSADCIQINDTVRSFGLTDGVIRGCGQSGAAALGGGDLSVSVSRVQSNNNGVAGLLFGFGAYGVVSESIAKNNLNKGIMMHDGVIEDSIAIGNGSYGLQVVSGLVRGCVATDNGIANVFVSGGNVVDTYHP